MSGHGPGIQSIGQIAVVVKDVERAADFYERVLGLPLLFTFPGLAFFSCGGVRLMLSRAEKPEHDHTSVLYYRVPDIGPAAAALERQGVAFEREPHVVHRDERHELWLAFFHDSEGNLLALMEERPA